MGVNSDRKIGEKAPVALGYNSNSTSKDSQISLGYFNTMAKSIKLGVVYTSISGNSKGCLDKGVTGTFTANSPNAIQLVVQHSFYKIISG